MVKPQHGPRGKGGRAGTNDETRGITKNADEEIEGGIQGVTEGAPVKNEGERGRTTNDNEDGFTILFQYYRKAKLSKDILFSVLRTRRARL